MSTALYRKYRSGTLAELVGQEHVATTLRNELRRGTTAHAYLFAGTRGTGKTSTARILARAVNCLTPVDGEPCNVCAACTEILGGGAVDVLEIDAASNRGIDEMRDLREKVKFLPASLRRKVYIIDEAHMLTTEAWNALLKTLEEPPPHVLFVLATTEPHKVPDTVRSRVQRFDFRRVDRAAMAAHLSFVVGREGVEVDGAALDLLARAGQGSLRDALSLLDQALASGERPVGVEAARRALGLADPETMRALLVALAEGDAAAALRSAARAFDAGVDARQLLREASRLARGAEMAAIGYVEGAELGAEEVELCVHLGSVAPAGFWIGALDRFSETEINLRQPVDARLQVELCLLRLTRGGVAVGDLAARVERLEALVGGGGSATVGEEAHAAVVAGAPAEPGASATGVAMKAETRSTVEGIRDVGRTGPALDGGSQGAGREHPMGEARGSAATGEQGLGPGTGDAHVAVAVEPAAAVAAIDVEGSPARGVAVEPPADVEGWQRRWQAVVDAVNRRDPMLAGVLRTCRPVAGGPDHLTIGAPYGFHLERLQDPQKAPRLAEAVAEVAGAPCAVTALFSGEEGPRPGPGAAPNTEEENATQAVLTAFPGSRVVGSRLRDHAVDGGAT